MRPAAKIAALTLAIFVSVSFSFSVALAAEEGPGVKKLTGKRTDTYNLIARFEEPPAAGYEIMFQYQKSGEKSWKGLGGVTKVGDANLEGNDLVKRFIPSQNGIESDGKYNFRIIGAAGKLSESSYDTASDSLLEITFVSRDQIIDTGLKPPELSGSISSGMAFDVRCEVDTPYFDCVDAYASENHKCNWKGFLTGDFRDGWDGNKAVFSCDGLVGGSYSATCVANPGTPDNCKSAESSKSYSVAGSIDGVSSGAISFDGCNIDGKRLDLCSQSTSFETDKIVYCRTPLTVPKSELSASDSSRANVRNSQSGDDNRYFVFVSSLRDGTIDIFLDGVDDVNVERLDGGGVEKSASDGKRLAVSGSSVFIVHANPSKQTGIPLLESLPCLGLACKDKELSIRSGSPYATVTGSDDCDGLLASSLYSADYISGTNLGLSLYASLLLVNDELEKSMRQMVLDKMQRDIGPTVGAGETELTVKYSFDKGADFNLVEGREYYASNTLYSESAIPDSMVEYAKTELVGRSPSEVFSRIAEMIKKDIVYPTDSVIADLNNPSSEMYDPVAGSVAKIRQVRPGSETLEQYLKTPLKDGRILCICRHTAMLSATLARMAGVRAWVEQGRLQDPITGERSGHAWVAYVDESGQVQRFDGTQGEAKSLASGGSGSLDTRFPNHKNIFNELYRVRVPEILIKDADYSISEIKIGGQSVGTADPVDDVKTVSPRDLDAGIEYRIKLKSVPGKLPSVLFSTPDPDSFRPVSVAADVSGNNVRMAVMTYDSVNLVGSTDDIFSETLEDVNRALKSRARGIDFSLERARLQAAASVQIDRQWELLREIERLQEKGFRISFQMESSMLSRLTELEKAKAMLDAEEKSPKKAILETIGKASNSRLKGRVSPLNPSSASLRAAAGRIGIESAKFGSGAMMVTVLGPKFEEYGRIMDDSNLIMAGQISNAAGIGSLAVSGGATIASMMPGAVSEAVSGNAVLKQFVITRSALISGSVYTALAYMVATDVFCKLDSSSPDCGCTAAGGQAGLKLEKSSVKKGDRVKFGVYNAQNCDASISVDPPTSSDGRQIGKIYQQCQFQRYNTVNDDKYCIGEVTVEADPGAYRVRSSAKNLGFELFKTSEAEITVTR